MNDLQKSLPDLINISYDLNQNRLVCLLCGATITSTKLIDDVDCAFEFDVTLMKHDPDCPVKIAQDYLLEMQVRDIVDIYLNKDYNYS